MRLSAHGRLRRLELQHHDHLHRHCRRRLPGRPRALRLADPSYRRGPPHLVRSLSSSRLRHR
ncbi:MAG TPA: hypothetical protein VFX41_04020, partial [Actinomycetales bacterium]|nr:hypothetical protein [Actinomycetales bacterium]